MFLVSIMYVYQQLLYQASICYIQTWRKLHEQTSFFVSGNADRLHEKIHILRLKTKTLCMCDIPPKLKGKTKIFRNIFNKQSPVKVSSKDLREDDDKLFPIPGVII